MKSVLTPLYLLAGLALAFTACSPDGTYGSLPENIPDVASTREIVFYISDESNGNGQDTTCGAPPSSGMPDTRCELQDITSGGGTYSFDCSLRDIYKDSFRLVVLSDTKVIGDVGFSNISRSVRYDPYGICGSYEWDSSGYRIGLRLPRDADPSKIEILAYNNPMPIRYQVIPTYSYLGNTDYTLGADAESLFDESRLGDGSSPLYLLNVHPAGSCTFFKRHFLCGENDWDKIDTSITLKRLNSIIYVCYKGSGPVSVAGTQYAYSFYNNSVLLNFDGGIDRFLNDDGTVRMEDRLRYADTNISSYDIMKDRSEIYVNDFCRNLEKNARITYRASNAAEEATYSIRNFIALFADEEKAYPVDAATNREVRYITDIIYEEEPRYGYGNYNSHARTYGDGTHIHWVSYPLPEGGIQRNKIYVYLVGLKSSDINTWTIGDIPTRGGNPATVSEGSYQILEFDMDEPLPFEIIGEE